MCLKIGFFFVKLERVLFQCKAEHFSEKFSSSSRRLLGMKVFVYVEHCSDSFFLVYYFMTDHGVNKLIS